MRRRLLCAEGFFLARGNVRGMPFYAAALVLALLVALGFQQALSDVLAQRAAVPASLIAHLPERFGALRGLAPAQRLLIAREAIAENDIPATRRALANLPPGPDRSALEGELAERAGNMRAATAAYFIAGDMPSLARMTTRVLASGDTQGALALQETIVRRAEEERIQPDALADAWLRLGQIEDLIGRQKPAERAAHARRAMNAYEKALTLTPLSQTYLLNAGYEALYLGDFQRSETLFVRAHEADPKSADASTGLERVRAAALKARR